MVNSVRTDSQSNHASSLPPFIVGLLRQDAFPHPARNLELRETHISWVILAGQYAYKVKKPVNFGFLDFSTIDRRRTDCEDEVRLNRRLCPDLYLGVVDVVQRNDNYAIGGAGPVVEPAVWMRRLPDDGMLASRLDRGTADARLMLRLAQHLAAFHEAAGTGPGVDEHGSLATIRSNWDENFLQFQTASLVGRTLSEAQCTAIQTYVTEFVATHETLFEERVKSGRIRDGHGDLHAGSICATRRGLYLFDCIEFNTRFRCADVAAEVAFLAMDLDHAGRADLAQAFVDAYVRASHDGQVLVLLDFYRCYRACVRGKVLGFRLAEPALDSAMAERITNEARAYFDLAQAYTGGLGRRTIVVTMGLPASGKTTLARALAGRLGLVYLSSDIVRKQLARLAPTEHLLDAFESGLYSRADTQQTYAVMRRRAARWLKRGRSVVLDATYGLPAERAALRLLGRRSGAHLIVFVCTADESVLRSRLANRSQGDAFSASDARLEIWPALRRAYREPTDLPEAIAIDTTQSVTRTVESALGHVLGSGHALAKASPTRAA